MDLGSEIRDPEKTYPGSRGQKGTGSRIRIRNTDCKTWKSFKKTFAVINNNKNYSRPEKRFSVQQSAEISCLT